MLTPQDILTAWFTLHLRLRAADGSLAGWTCGTLENPLVWAARTDRRSVISLNRPTAVTLQFTSETGEETRPLNVPFAPGLYAIDVVDLDGVVSLRAESIPSRSVVVWSAAGWHQASNVTELRRRADRR